MELLNHTPGDCEISGGNLDIRATLPGGGFEFVARVYQPSDANALTPTDARSLANATLIVASPVLLRELRWLVEECSLLVQRGAMSPRTLARAHAAIKAATGGQP